MHAADAPEALHDQVGFLPRPRSDQRRHHRVKSPLAAAAVKPLPEGRRPPAEALDLRGAACEPRRSARPLPGRQLLHGVQHVGEVERLILAERRRVLVLHMRRVDLTKRGGPLSHPLQVEAAHAQHARHE